MSDDARYADQMTVSLARLLIGARNVFHGLASPLPAVAIALAKSLHNPRMEYLNITGGVDIDPSDLDVSTCAPGFLTGSRSFFSLIDIFDLSARGKLDVAFLGGVQIDRAGRINNSVIGSFEAPKVKLPGGAGSAAIVPTARRTIVWRTRHDARTIVERCDFVTAAGNVREVVTPLGILRVDDGELRIARWFDYSSEAEIRKQTGFPIASVPDAALEPPPTADELEALSRIDPKGVRCSEFR